MILTNVDDVSENKPFNSICIILALLCYTSDVTVPPIGTYIAENKKKMSREMQLFVRVTEHHVVKNPRNSSNNSDGNFITFLRISHTIQEDIISIDILIFRLYERRHIFFYHYSCSI